ncbi:MAG: carbohydrate ABC transporter permease [Treponema sp.]|nr:carbohydrate ABC transporter permease [Treponema sp.]
MSMVRKEHLWWRYVVLAIIVVVYLAPIYVLTGISFKPLDDLSSYWHFPSRPTLQNFTSAIVTGHIFTALKNTVIITGCSVLLIVAVGAMTAYPLARMKSKYTKLISGFALVIMMVPPLSILVPLYATLVGYGGINKYWGIVITLLTFELPLSIFLYMNFIKAIPKALDEAAHIDGAGPVRTFFQVIFPQVNSVTASVVILSGIHCWNDYQFSLYILQKTIMKPVTVAIAGFFSQETSNLNAAAAAALIVILPVIILFLVLQRYFIKGMVDSAIK